MAGSQRQAFRSIIKSPSPSALRQTSLTLTIILVVMVLTCSAIALIVLIGRVPDHEIQISVKRIVLSGLPGCAGFSGLFLFLQRRIKAVTLKQRRMMALVENANDAIIGKMLSGHVTDWNPAAALLFGYTPQEAIGRTLLDLIVPAELKFEETGILARVSRGEIVPHFQTYRHRKDGSLVHVSVTVSPIISPTGTIMGASKTIRDISAQVAAERKLKESQARLKLTTQSTGIALWEYDSENGTVVLDDAVISLYGRDRHNFPVTHEDWRELVHVDDIDAVETKLAAALAGGPAYDTSFRIITPAGDIRHMRAKGTVIKGEAGKPARMLGINYDITAEKLQTAKIAELNTTLEHQVEARTAELKKVSALQGAILASAGIGIITTDLTGTITLFNPAAECMLGYTSEDMVGKLTPIVIHDEKEVAARARTLSAELETVIEPGFEVFVAKSRTGTPDVNEWTYIRKDGTRFPVLLSVIALRSDDGSMLGYLGIAADLTEQHRQEQALRSSERFLQALTDNIPSLIAYWDRGLHCRFANKSFQEWFGKIIEQVHGRHLVDFFGDETYAAIKIHIDLALSGQAQKFEREVTKRDGNKSHIWVNYIPDIQDGSVHGFYALVTDVTELKQTQLNLEVRTREAEAATTAKSQFLANMSHEIRSPMNAILGMLQLILKTDLSDRQRDYACKAYAATQSLLHLLNDILDFSKIEAGKLTIESTSFVIETMIRDVASVLSVSAANKPVELVFSIDPNVPAELIGDPFRLRQVILNLTGNAIKFTPHGEVILSIRRMTTDSGQTLLEFSVEDTGIGIAAHHLTAIFEGFEQAEASTTRKYGGSGLGLAISQRLISLMGGQLGVESDLGKGSRFYFSIPLREAPASRAVADQRRQLSGRHKRVLVIDDNKNARESLMNIAISLGWIAESVDSGRQALELIAHMSPPTAYDVVLIDFGMPELDGWRTAREIRSLLPNVLSPVIIMLTVHGDEESVDRKQERGGVVNGVVAKPVTASMIADAVVAASLETAMTASRTWAQPQIGRLSGLSLLVVEDTPLNQQVAYELLLGEGALVTIAESGAQAIEKVLTATSPFDVVLMDIQMPGIDGYETTCLLRDIPNVKDIPIIAMTANAMGSDRAAALEAGMVDHIAKPIALDIVVETVLRHSRRKSGLSPSMTPSADIQTFADMDHHNALKRLGNNEALFINIAEGFMQVSGAILDDIERYFTTGCEMAALSELHKLKGLAGTVGAIALAGQIARLELELKANGRLKNRNQDIVSLRSLLVNVNDTLNSLADDFHTTLLAPPAISHSVDAITIKATVMELDKLLLESNMRAVAVCSQLRAQWADGEEQAMARLKRAVDRMDFKAARGELGILSKAMT